jgi:hypothetical protein
MLDLHKTTNNRQRVGAPLGNRNALVHGRRTSHAELQRRLTCARLKAITILGNSISIFDPAPRPRPLRPDQLELLREFQPGMYDHLMAITPVREFWSCASAIPRRICPA